jgi:sugar-phosphatase
VSGVLSGDAIGLGELVDQVFDAVIFDMDGTLIDSTPAVRRSWNTWAGEHGLTPADLESQHGIPSAGVVRALLPESMQAAAIERINELEIGDVGGIVVLPGAAEALAALAQAKNAIATSCTRPLANARIKAAQLTPPSIVVTVDDVARGKPHPDPFFEAARRLGVDPTRCLVVEDAPAGLQAAATAGCFTLAVITTTPRNELEADGVVPDLASVAFEATPAGITVRLAE